MLNLSIGIITNGKRIEDLKRCILSIEDSINYAHKNNSIFLIKNLVVSNDGEIELISPLQNGMNLNWRFIEGPRKGVGANRNNVLRNIKGQWFLITDDDMSFPKDFILKSINNIKNSNQNCVITGGYYEKNNFVGPTQPDFWGYRRIPIFSQTNPKGFSDPVCWMPYDISEKCIYDESVVYGPTEMDFAFQINYEGYKIKYVENLFAYHHGFQEASIKKDIINLESSRIFCTIRRYRYWEKSYLNLIIFLILEPLRLSFALTRRYGVKGISFSFKSYLTALKFSNDKKY